jgi:hypothetical protein
MDTNELIETLASDARQPPPSLPSVWWGATGAAMALAAGVFFTTLGVRPDIAAAAESPRFLFKFVVTIALAASAFGLVRALSRPGEAWRKVAPFLAVAPCLIIGALLVELSVSAPETWTAKMAGMNSLFCVTYVTLIGIGPLGFFLLALRYGATTRPALSGAVAGLLAGGIAATFYAVQCMDDSPLFVAVWYPLAVGLLALTGSVAASRLCRW